MATRKRFLLRIDPELYRALERWAADDLRSVNAQIEFLLTRAVERSGRGRPSEDEPRPSRPGTESSGGELG